MPAAGSTSSPDFTTAARKPLERLRIVEYVLNTAGLQETDYLEWKTGYDLSGKPGAAATAKHLIGFANRDFPLAARHAEGHAYLLLGVEPGNLVGVTEWDSADVQQWLERFTGTDIRYDLHYVETGAKKVMFLTVDPPRPGDPIFCMQSASSDPGGRALPEGAIYVRRNGLTAVSSAQDVKRLAGRTSGVPVELTLGLTLDGSDLVPLPEEALTTAARDAWLREQEHDLLSSLPAEPAGLGYRRMPLGVFDHRKPDEFRMEVAAYIDNAQRHWPNIVAADHIEDVGSTFVAVVANYGADNYEDVVVEMTLPFPGSWLHVNPEDARDLKPKKPARFGAGILGPNLEFISRGVLPITRAPRPEFELVDEHHTLVRFPPMLVRPHTSHRTDAVSLLVLPDAAGTTIEVEWRMTARNRSGQVAGTGGLTVPRQAGVVEANQESREVD